MPASCVIPDCNLKYTHSEDVSYHKFPFKNPDLLKQWIQFTGRGDSWHPTQWSAICSRHFVARDFKDCQFRKKLLPNIVPSVRTVVSKIHSSDLCVPLAYETVWPQEEPPHHEDYQLADEVEATLCPVAVSENGDELAIEGEDNPLIEITCRICGVVFIRAADSLLNDIAQTTDLVRKYLPFVNLDLPNMPQKICLNCSKEVNGFAKFSTSVQLAQSDLEYRFGLDVVRTFASTSHLPVARTKQESASSKPMNIKQEPLTSLNIKEEKVENAINSRQKEHLVPEPLESAVIVKSQAFGGETNRIFLVNNLGQDRSNDLPTGALVKQHTRESSKNCEILEIVNLYPPIVDITSTTDTEVQPYELTPPSVMAALASDPLPLLPSSAASMPPQFVGGLKVENTAEMDEDQDEYYLPDKFPFINTLEEHSYTKLPIQADDNKDEIFPDMTVGGGQWFETTECFSASQRSEPTQKGWACKNCGRRFMRRGRLLCHRVLECPERSKQSACCQFCQRKFPSWSRLRAHVCTCPKRALKRKRLREMMLRHQQTTKLEVEGMPANREEMVLTKCPMCDRTYSNASNLRRHLSTHRPPELWNHKCGVCLHVFDKLFDLKKHLQLSSCASGGNTNPDQSTQPAPDELEENAQDAVQAREAHRLLYVCSTCNKMFQSYNSLKVHEPIHTGTKAFICETCGKRFSGRSNLWQHRLTHSELRQFCCKQCPKVFKRSGGLSQHVRAIHMKIKPYQCGTCGHEYALKADMTRCRHSRLNDSTTPAC